MIKKLSLSTIDFLKSKVLSGHDQSVELKKNVVYSLGIKFLQMALGIIYLPVVLNFVDKSTLGIVMTITSIISWLYLSDIGIGNGFKNKFTKAISSGNNEKARSITSTAYISLFLILILICVISLIVAGFINWNELLKVDTDPNKLLWGIRFAIFALLMTFGLRLINKVLQSFQLNYLNNIIDLLIKIMTLSAVFIAIHITTGSFLKYIAISQSIPIIVFTLFSIILFYSKFKYYRPSIKYFEFSEVKNITSLGFKFFFIQITAMILFATDNIIIARLFSTADVTVYNVIRKYYFNIWVIFSFISVPLWPAYTKAYARQDFVWIKRITKKILKISLILSGIILIMLLVYKPVIRIWLQGKIEVPLLLSVFMGFSVIIMLIVSPFVNFINGVGKLKVSLRVIPFVAIFNIPLSILFAKYLGMGIAGVIFATCVCNGASMFVSATQYYKIVYKKSEGIWNQ